MLNKKELDFPTIRNNFKEFLKDQDEFSDYDLTQSGLDVIINLLSYGIHYDAFQANFSNNEMMLESSQLRKNVVSKAKHLSYTPKSAVSAKMMVNVIVEDTESTTLPNTIFIPKGSKFTCKNEEQRDISFVTVENYIANKEIDTFYFNNVSLYEGFYNTTYEKYNGKEIIILNKNIDTRFIEVYVQESAQSSVYTKYEKAGNILSVNSNSKIFYLEENADENFKVYFGDGVLGKKVNKNSNVIVTYLQTNGEFGNGISLVRFTKTTNPDDDLNDGQVTVTTLENSSGGAPRESIESIKFNAPKYFSTQKIILNDTDATFIIPQMFSDIKSTNIWSGKGSGAFGKTYISLNPYEDNLTDARIEEILSELEDTRFVILTDLVHVEPSYIDLGIKMNVYYSTTTSTTSINNVLYEKILKYSEDNIEDFKKNFISSRFISTIDTSDGIEYDFDIDMKYRMSIFTNSVETYLFDFKNEITSVSSSDFTWRSTNVFIKDDGAGVLNIHDLNSGILLSSIGTVDYSTGSLQVSDINIQAATDNVITFTAAPKRESIFGVNNNILRILEEDIEITYEIKN